LLSAIVISHHVSAKAVIRALPEVAGRRIVGRQASNAHLKIFVSDREFQNLMRRYSCLDADSHHGHPRAQGKAALQLGDLKITSA
jgi:hypothetical protein